ncbi:MAG: peptidylprolyl isomerase [Erysipelotrichaceae bacterium]|jgi:peptidyl-prolyl cis-trans isomerase B (cyclophilin B)|nr:peptidylprolyl isomerase [Erysipelotrichaceae bacterium]MCI9523872.1 peptidylprolyl isomerase [Erysipelotrichaceae bacterium]
MILRGSITMENNEVIPFELYSDEAPKTVENFVKLIKEGYYNGKTFHRVIAHFVSQGGCPYGNGTGDLGYTIPCETQNNPHRHEEGSLSMAHRGKDTGCCQFFICHEPQPHLDGVHTVFGKVIGNMEAVRNMKNGDVMRSVTLED